MTSAEIRERYLRFFEKRGHKIIPSASLVPENDPSSLFITAGMQQFKRYYLFPNETSSSRITTVQKCIRTGDIDEVGDDTHLTFFEMLGNFSFGYPKAKNSYFKKEAIEMAWEFLTEVLKIDAKRISATYFKGEDDLPADTESYDLLKDITKLPENRIKGTGKSETFWSLGTEGSPGGPTVEFYVDDVEVWNLVFNQYVIRNGKYVELEYKGVDTGMGFERLVAMIQGKKSVYETDLFEPIITNIKENSKNNDGRSARIVVDHIRSAVFIIADGILPSNTECGYVLRRILRRVTRFIDKLGLPKKAIFDLTKIVITNFSYTYPELKNKEKEILEIIKNEDLKFRLTLERGLKEFEKGSDAFSLFQTYGFPIEMTVELSKEKGMNIDMNEFNNMMKKHQKISKAGSEQKFKGGLGGTGTEETKYHTATHLLLSALRNVLKGEIVQKGSNITAERMRFDFNWPEKVPADKLKEVEDLVNKKIQEKLPVEMMELPKEEAKKIVTTLSFDLSKYGDVVKVYKIGDVAKNEQAFSAEFCGGPHVSNTSELGHFKIVKEEAVSAGVRRIKAILE